MTWARVGTGTGKKVVDSVATGSTTITGLPSTTANNWLVCCGSIFQTGTTPAIAISLSDSSGAGSWTVLTSPNGNNKYSFIAFKENIASGITTVTINAAGSSNFYCVSADEFSGGATTSSQDKTTGATGARPLSTGSITNTGNPNDLIIAVANSDDSGSSAWVANSGWTTFAEEGDSTVHVCSKSIFQIASSNTGPWSATFDYPIEATAGSAIIASFVPAGGGAAAQAIPVPDVHPGRGPGKRPFPEFKQGVLPPSPTVNAGPPLNTLSHPGRGPGKRPFPNFVQGVTAAAATGSIVSGDGSITSALTGQMVGASLNTGAISETSTATGQMVGASTASGAFSEASTLSGLMVGASTAAGAFSAITQAIAQMAGASFASGAFNSTLAATVIGTGASTASGAISETATATVIGTGASTASGAISETSVATVVGTGASTASGVISETATGQVLGASPTTVASAAASSTSTATVLGVGQSTASGDVSETATATVQGVGASTAAGTITEASVASVTGSGASIAAGVITETASGQALGNGAALSGGIVSAAGSITASGSAFGASASTVKRRVDGARPRRSLYRPNDDEELLALAAMLVPLISPGGALCRH